MIVPQPIYEPLYSNKDKFIILVTGGRGSGKSFNVSTFIERLTFEKGHVMLFCRYTMTSASISVIPEFTEKIELDNTSKYFAITNSEVVNLLSGSRVLFRGIKTSSGNQTAKLKSIQGVTTFICDEAEEWTSETDFEKIMLSIRQKDIQNRIIIIMNPTNTAHFVYKKYIKDTHEIRMIDGIPVQISTHPNVLHIHTTYLDNIDFLGTEFLKEMNVLKESNPSKYATIAMGRWADMAEGVVFPSFDIVEEMPTLDISLRGLGMDFGYTDPTAIVDVAVVGDCLYIDEICYKSGLLGTDIIKELKPYSGVKVMSEPADPRLIKEIKQGGINIYPVDKSTKNGKGSIETGLLKMLEYNIKVTRRSVNLIYELRNYVWDKDMDGKTINVPVDKDNHAIDAARYFVLGLVLGRTLKKQDLTGIFY